MAQKNKHKQCLPRSPNSNVSESGEVSPGRASRILRIVYWAIVAAVVAFILSWRLVFASNIWDTFSNIMQDIYGRLLGISTIIAVTAATIALLVRMISRNQRAVDEATTWLKRIIVTWIILNTLGFIIAYIQPLIQGGQFTM
jgi:hypothetical protein